jgi:glycosyltransferase involved in cell wall biosynthesis
VTKDPAITVMIPVYDGERYIEQTLRSLLGQTFADFEVVCVNDGSRDGSLAILESLAKEDPRLRVFSKPNGGNATQALVHGLERARGRYFMYSSQDDLFSPDLLEKTHARALATGADAVVPDMDYYWGDGEHTPGIHGVAGDRSGVLTGPEAFGFSLDWTIHGFALWDMGLVRRLGFHDYGLSSDEYSTRMFFFHCRRVAFSEGVFYFRQNNPQAITKKWNVAQLDYVETCKRLERFAIEHGRPRGEIERIRRVLLAELVRVRILFNQQKGRLPADERAAAEARIRHVYRENREVIRSIDAVGLKQSVRQALVGGGHLPFAAWCRLIQGYAGVRAWAGKRPDA